MIYTVSGKIVEKETNNPLSGLNVKLCDESLLYDHLFKFTKSDEKGNFKLTFINDQYQEIFSNKPRVTVEVYTSTYQLIFNQKNTFIFGENGEEYFEIEISRYDLKGEDSGLSNEYIGISIDLAEDCFKIIDVDGYQVPILPNCIALDLPGEPMLPGQIHQLAIPLGSEVIDIKIDTGEPVIIENVKNPMATQDSSLFPQADNMEMFDASYFSKTEYEIKPLSDKFLNSKEVYPTNLVEMEDTQVFNHIQVVAVKVIPLQYDFVNECCIFYPNLTYKAIIKQSGFNEQIKAEKIGEAEVEVLNQFLDQKRVYRVKDLKLPNLAQQIAEVPYVIITDNYRWYSNQYIEKYSKGDKISDKIVAEFDRLAQWKTSKGVRSKVVTVSQIVDGDEFGDMTDKGKVRDLPEVIRNFIKYANEYWKTSYFLLGGDVNVVPIRYLCGSDYDKQWGVYHQKNPPDAGRCFLDANNFVIKIHADFVPNRLWPLVTCKNGKIIPYDENASSTKLGWYFTTPNDFKNKRKGFARITFPFLFLQGCYIIVEGPKKYLDDRLYWYNPTFDGNVIPSDFYYASIKGKHYSKLSHRDFDMNNNSLYGQYNCFKCDKLNNFDGVDFKADVFIGRASVDCITNVTFFVNKVISYEKMEYWGKAVDLNYLKKIIYISSAHVSWFEHPREKDPSVLKPGKGKYTYNRRTNEIRLHLLDDNRLNIKIDKKTKKATYRLIARTKQDIDTKIEYNTHRSGLVPEWHFCTDDTYSNVSYKPTNYVLITGPNKKIYPYPGVFVWDKINNLDHSTNLKEFVRSFLTKYFPHFNQIERYYDDYFEISPPPHIQKRRTEDIIKAINRGCHFLSLSGHGSYSGCCGIFTGADSTFYKRIITNKYFIVYANSCDTAMVDKEDSAAEKLTYQRSGAVAYIGNTRVSRGGDEVEFWRNLNSYKRLGPAVGLNNANSSKRNTWHQYIEILLGDPEMPVYTKVPDVIHVTRKSNESNRLFKRFLYPVLYIFSRILSRLFGYIKKSILNIKEPRIETTIDITHYEKAYWGKLFSIDIDNKTKEKTTIKITIMAGWKGGLDDSELYQSISTNKSQTIYFSLPRKNKNKATELYLTVDGANVKPYTTKIPLV